MYIAMQPPLSYALGVLTPKASHSAWVFSQAQHPMIKTFKYVRRQGTLRLWRAKIIR